MNASELVHAGVVSTPGCTVSTGVDTISKPLLCGENGRFHCLMATLGVILALLLTILFRLQPYLCD
jgi:hypothetical protein